MGSMVTVREGGCSAYLAEGSGPSVSDVAVILLQEWWGLNSQMRGLVDRMAADGFSAACPDLYHGKVAATPDEAGHLMTAMDWPQAIEDIKETARFIRSRGGASAATKVVLMGFCMGGALAIAASAAEGSSGLFAGSIAFYGIPPLSSLDASKVCCPLQLHFASKDTSCGFSDAATLASLEKLLSREEKPFETFIYDADHAFMNESRPEVYDEPSAKAAYERCMSFIRAL